jgi:UDP-N-acetylmuramoyl-tripeptide--D-alanyl-D-alanine ligase
MADIFNSNLFFLIFAFFWLAAFNKKLLFWIYLWQLKEYHPGRFLAHFQTEKGKSLLFNKVYLLKALFLVSSSLFLYSSRTWVFPSAVFLLFLIEGGKSLFGFARRKNKLPVFTKKAVLTVSAGFLMQVFFLPLLVFMVSGKGAGLSQNYSGILYYYFLFLFLLIIDLFAPFFATVLVFLFHPFAVFWRKRMISLAAGKRKSFSDLLVIGITGSYGKTSTKEFLYTMLSEKFGEKVLKTSKHQNSEIGISKCILNDLKPEHSFFICEMGAYGPGGIKLLADICRPGIGIITGLNEQHLATFGSKQDIINTKFELISSLPGKGTAIFNGTDPEVRKAALRVKEYNPELKTAKVSGFSENDDIRAENISVKKDSLSFKAVLKSGEEAEFSLPLLGAHNIPNILLAALCSSLLGLSLEEISEACRKIDPSQSGMQLKRIKEFNVIDATYSANPSGVISHLEYLKSWPGKKALLMPCLIELGSSAKEIHKMIGREIGKVCEIVILTSKDYFKEIREGALESGMREENIVYSEDLEKIAAKLEAFKGEGDVVLFESRVPEKLFRILEKK